MIQPKYLLIEADEIERMKRLYFSNAPTKGDSKVFVESISTAQKVQVMDVDEIKEAIMDALNKRITDAFNNDFHRYKERQLANAIIAIRDLMPPSYFENLQLIKVIEQPTKK